MAEPCEKAPWAKIAVARPLPGKPEWTVWVTAYTTDDLLKPFQLAVVFLQATRITRPIIQLQAVIARLAGGDLRPSEGSVLRLLNRRDELGAMRSLGCGRGSPS